VKRIGVCGLGDHQEPGHRDLRARSPPTPRLARRSAGTIEAYGWFIEMFVATPLERVRAARPQGHVRQGAGRSDQGHTGIDDPTSPRVPRKCGIDTTRITDEAAQEVLLYLGQKGFI